jgi:uncharacterized protein (DUF2344 family)
LILSKIDISIFSSIFFGMDFLTTTVGAVEENSRNLALEIIPNRKKETIQQFIVNNIRAASIIKTDGHPSYPYAVNKNGCDHIVVNHQEGFENSEGHTTNLIECEWSLFKADVKTRKSVPGTAMPRYVEEYIWRRRNMNSTSLECLNTAFGKLVSLFLQKRE